MPTLCFVDLETTGSDPLRDGITEVAIVSVHEDGTVEHWSQLFNPQQDIPPFIQQLTGITPALVADAPVFAEQAQAIWQRLQGNMFIAHNARFDYGFLRAALRQCGLTLKTTVLCTVKMSRWLDPREARHNLDALIARHGLPSTERHRALADAQALWALWQHWQVQLPAERVQQAIAELTRRPNLPEHLDADLIDELPTGCGVYLMLGEGGRALHVGSSAHLKHRVLSHFSPARPSAFDLTLALQIRSLRWQTTAGELGAQLLQRRWQLDLQPALDRPPARQDELCAWHWQPGQPPRLVHATDAVFIRLQDVYGLYRTAKEAQKSLHRLAQKHKLCLKRLGLEKGSAGHVGGRPGKPCAGRLTHHCLGACVGREDADSHDQRLAAALAELRLAVWPWAGRIGVRERDARSGQVDIHWVDHWCYLGSSSGDSAPDLRIPAAFDVDIYRILQRALRQWPATDIIVDSD